MSEEEKQDQTCKASQPTGEAGSVSPPEEEQQEKSPEGGGPGEGSAETSASRDPAGSPSRPRQFTVPARDLLKELASPIEPIVHRDLLKDLESPIGRIVYRDPVKEIEKQVRFPVDRTVYRDPVKEIDLPIQSIVQPVYHAVRAGPWSGTTRLLVSSGPQVTDPSAWFAPRARRDGRARRWSNGYSFIQPRDTAGLCSLKVSNGTDRDAVVKMVSAAKTEGNPDGVLCRFVYICGGQAVTIKGIGAGDYWLFFCTGTRWDRKGRRFREPYAARKFAEAMTFTQTDTAEGVRYSTNEVTLHPVAEGRARTASVDMGQFDGLQ